MQRVTEFSQSLLPPALQTLFLAFALYLIVPIIDLPILGLSLSAPMMALIALPVILGRHPAQPKDNYTPWLIFAYVFWVALLLSLVVNNLLTVGFKLTQGSLVTLIQYGYWVITFLITIRIITSESLTFIRRLILLIGIGTVVLTGLRLAEAILYGRWGAWTDPQILSQNYYGLRFSTLAPMVVILPFVVKPTWRIPAIVSVFALIAAVAGNGSRSSWIAVGVGVIVIMLLYALAQPRHISRFAVAAGLVVSLMIVTVSAAPLSILQPIASRFVTLENIDDDKSFQIRLLMIQKSVRLFERNPLFGIGLNRFNDVNVPLDIPVVLDYGTQAHFDVKASHNSYMSLLAEVGLVGFIPYALLLITLTARGALAALRLGQRGELWAIAVYAGFVGMSIHLWTVSSLTDTLPWFIYGLVAAMILRDRAAPRETA